MEWLIDGYNLLISNDLGHDEAARERFRHRIGSHFAGKQVSVTVVYDSRGSAAIQRERITGAFSEIYVDNADQFIIETIERHPRPRSIIVVTDDREILLAVRGRRPQRMSTVDFLARIDSPAVHRRREAEKPESETPENIERYLRIFGQDRS
ncbi:MAG: NYN domain-containing protein [PVC group bacterium]